MKEEFDDFLKNRIPIYDAPFIKDHKYVILIKKNGNISYALGNIDYTFLVEYPQNNKEYSTPEKVLQEELELCNASHGIIYENIDGKGNFQSIAFIDNTKKC